MRKNSCNRKKIPSFVTKLINMIQDQESQQIISKIDEANGFTIISISDFTETVLPRYFSHNNLSSFIRQLNMYGFKKIKDGQGNHSYTHDNFQIENKNSLKKIKRKSNKQEDQTQGDIHSGILKIPYCQQIQKIKQKQIILEQKCQDLISQNSGLMQQNYRLTQALQEQNQQKQIFARKLKNFFVIYSRINKQANMQQQNLKLQYQNNFNSHAIQQGLQNYQDYLSINDFLTL